ncbi:hypothetical protein [Nocardioides speluncae]|uniref:hypothetical protein n=1 Tax=Nocardioides speluncae TaxID=2670337 RepID=UPI000D6854A6|nr:hypothetical protein [Nocardioides speluncae]
MTDQPEAPPEWSADPRALLASGRRRVRRRRLALLVLTVAVAVSLAITTTVIVLGVTFLLG